jgi:hypothetical protein
LPLSVQVFTVLDAPPLEEEPLLPSSSLWEEEEDVECWLSLLLLVTSSFLRASVVAVIFSGSAALFREAGPSNGFSTLPLMSPSALLRASNTSPRRSSSSPPFVEEGLRDTPVADNTDAVGTYLM